MKEDLFERLRGQRNVLDVLEDPELRVLASRCSYRFLASGEVLFEEGEENDFLCIILKGKIDIRKMSAGGGRPMLIAVLGPGSPIGEFSFLDGQARDASAIAAEDAELAVLSRENLDAYAKECPTGGVSLYRALGQVLVRRLRKAMERVSVLA